MDGIIQSVAEVTDQKAALASLIWSSGSIPMSDRAKMLIREDGTVFGTIGGGCLEAEIFSVARQVIESGKAHITRYTMTEKQAGESGLNCGGSVRIYTELIAGSSASSIYARVLTAQRERISCVLATFLDSRGGAPAKTLVFEQGGQEGSLGTVAADDQVQQASGRLFNKESGRVIELELDEKEGIILGASLTRPVEVFLEPYSPSPILYIFGGGHVGGQICKLAKNVGFRVVVIDDRPMFANADRHPDAEEFIVEEMEDVFHNLEIDDQSYIVAATRGHQHDEVVVRNALLTPARYIGMLGSERKKLLMWKKLEGEGSSRERLDEIYAPIGLNIGADSPEEIAVSVVSELIKARRGSRKVWKTKSSGV